MAISEKGLSDRPSYDLLDFADGRTGRKQWERSGPYYLD
jgi:hypothetical protein